MWGLWGKGKMKSVLAPSWRWGREGKTVVREHSPEAQPSVWWWLLEQTLGKQLRDRWEMETEQGSCWSTTEKKHYTAAIATATAAHRVKTGTWKTALRLISFLTSPSHLSSPYINSLSGSHNTIYSINIGVRVKWIQRVSNKRSH